jgi:HK97 family phage portal protein
MGIFSRNKRAEPMPEVSPPVSDVLLRALLNNEPITREQALTLPAVSGAVDFICGTIASMPVKLYKIKDGKIEEQDRDPRVKLLNGDTGDTLDGFQFKKAIVEDYLLGKGGYAYIQRDGNDVTGLYYVADIFVSIMRNYDPIHKDFVLWVWEQEYKPYEFLKVLRNTKDGASGIGLTWEVGKALETAYRTLLYQLGLVKSGGNKRGFIKSQNKLTQEAIDTLKAAWRNLYANNEENVVVLNNGLEFQESSNTSVEMQLNESKKTLQDEINSIFHITPDFYTTFKEAIYPIIRAFETALNRDLLLEKEKGKYFFEFDVKETLRVNINERYAAYKLAKETGFMTLNEIRRQENLDNIEGLDVINVGLGAVLYDVNTGTYYTPNTDTQALLDTQKVIEAHEIDQAFDESGNSST